MADTPVTTAPVSTPAPAAAPVSTPAPAPASTPAPVTPPLKSADAAPSAPAAPAAKPVRKSLAEMLDAIGGKAPPTDTKQAPSETEGHAAPEVAAPAKTKPAESETPPAEEGETVEAKAPASDDETEFPEPDEVRTGKNGKKYHLYEPTRLEKWKQRSTMVHELEGEIPGFNVELAKQHYSASVSAKQLLDDYGSAEPASIDTVIDFFGSQSPHALGMMAVRLPGKLAQVNPEAYGALREGMFAQGLDGLYQQAVDQVRSTAEGSEANKIAQNLVRALQVIEHTKRGTFRKVEDFKPRDPLADRNATLTAREQALNNREAQTRRQQTESFVNQVDQSITSATSEEIEAALAPVKDSYADRPRELKRLVRDFEDAIADKVENSQVWKTEEQTIIARMQRALQRGDRATAEKERDTLVSRYRQMAQQVIRANRKSLIESDTRAVIAQNGAAHQRASTAAKQTELAAASHAQVPNTNPALEKIKSAKTISSAFDELDKMFPVMSQ